MINRNFALLIIFISASLIPIFAFGSADTNRNEGSIQISITGKGSNAVSRGNEPDPRISQPEYKGVDNIYIHNRTTNSIDRFTVIQAGANGSTLINPFVEVENKELYHTCFAWQEGFPLEFAVVAVFKDGCEIRTNFVAELSREQKHSVFLEINEQRTISIRVEKPFVRSAGITRIISGGVPRKGDDRIWQYQGAAEGGDADAQFEIGEVYGSRPGEVNIAEAIKWYRKAAEQGHTKAQLKLGVNYALMPGHKQESLRWYRQAAEIGVPEAQLWLGTYYELLSDKTNPEEAAKWYRKAAEQGNAKAQCLLGTFYMYGTGVARDGGESVKWFRKAAAQGDAGGQFRLGSCYAEGFGVAKDELEAVRWFKLAADQGDSLAQRELGRCYATGAGVEKDEQQALKWFRKAAVHGDIKARELLKEK